MKKLNIIPKLKNANDETIIVVPVTINADIFVSASKNTNNIINNNITILIISYFRAVLWACLEI